MAAFTKRRMPAYMGGLLLSLGAMIVIMQAKKAFAPNFHELVTSQPAEKLAPGGVIKIIYNEEPGYFLPPGFPSRVLVAKKQADVIAGTVSRLAYRNLVDGKEVMVATLADAGEYILEAELYICKAPGVADCTKLKQTGEYMVDPAATEKESKIPLDLPALAQRGLDARPAGE